MTTFERYIVRQVLGPLGFSLGLALAVLLLGRTPKLVELVALRGVSLGQVATVLAAVVPSLLEMALPMGVLLGTLVGVGRMREDSEIVAWVAAGRAPRGLLRPLFALGLVASAVTAAVAWGVRPWGLARFETALADIARTHAAAALQPRVFNDRFDRLVVYVDHIDPGGTVLRDVLVAGDLSSQGTSSQGKRANASSSTALAREARLAPWGDGVVLQLLDGSIHTLGPDSGQYERTDFARMDVALDFGGLIRRSSTVDPARLDAAALWTAAQPATNSPAGIAAAIEVQRRLALPAACLGFALLAGPLAIRIRRNVWSRAVAVTAGVVAAYHSGLTAAEATAGTAFGTPLLIWLPNLVTLALASALWWRARI